MEASSAGTLCLLLLPLPIFAVLFFFAVAHQKKVWNHISESMVLQRRQVELIEELLRRQEEIIELLRVVAAPRGSPQDNIQDRNSVRPFP